MGEVKDSLGDVLRHVPDYHPDWEMLEIGIDRDHVHLHMVIPPKYSVADAIASIKRNTSKELRDKYNFHKTYWDDSGIWSVGYFVSTTSIDEDIIRKYVAAQGSEDSSQLELEF